MRLSGLTVGCTEEMTGKGRRPIISYAMTESGPVRGALWMFKADGKGKKRKIESKSKELSGEKKSRKLDSESTERKEDTVDGGENDSKVFLLKKTIMIRWMGKVINVILKSRYVKIYRNTRLS